MENRTKWHSLFTAGIDESDPHLFTRVIFTNALMYVVGFVLLFFAVMHFFFTHQYMLAAFDSAILLLVVVLYFYLRVTKSLRRAGHLSALGMLLFFVTFIPATQAEDLSVFWLVFAPLFIILINGWRVGALYLSVLYLILFPMAYFNIGIWDSGHWNGVSFYRLVIGLLLASFVAVLIDVSQSYSNQREQKTREKEALYLKELKRLSMTDGLTTIYNRHYFNQVFAEKIEALKSSQHYLMFFIVDIDHFKSYNDFYGHQAGDAVIQRVAETVREYIRRENDWVFRLGGEEFGGLIETRDPQQTAEWLTQLTEVVENLKIPHAPSVKQPYVTISGGVSSMQVLDKSSMSLLYRRADEAMYQSKHQGRNQFCIDEPRLRTA